MRAGLVILTCLWVGLVSSSEATAVDIGGYVLTDWRARTSDGELLWNENRVNVEIDASPVGDVHVFAQVWVRGFAHAAADSLEDLMGHNKRKSNPWDLVLREAYVDLYGFLTPDLDLRVGRQRITWGTADNINPTDNLNPDDLEDIWDFGRHVPTSSILAKYYWGETMVSGVFVPGFTPAALPPREWAAALTSSPPFLAGDVMPNAYSNELDLPGRSLKEQASGAIKATRTVLNYDLSVSYYGGRSDFPVVTGATLTPDESDGVDVHSTLAYPRMDVLGADMSGTLRDVGIWAEVGVFFPEEVWATLDQTGIGGERSEFMTLPDEPFVRYVVGGDYTFPGGLYINGQIAHGFVHQLGRDALHDYIAGGVEKGFRSDTVKLTLAAAVELPDITDPGDDYAIVGMPEIAYHPWDGGEMTLGAHLIEASGHTNFGQLTEMDEIYVAFTYFF
jgi:hypothetical protein